LNESHIGDRLRAIRLPATWVNARYYLVFVFTFLVLWCSPVTQLEDSRYSLLLSESILTRLTPDLSGYSIPEADPKTMPAVLDVAHLTPTYQLVYLNQKILYYYPHGTSFLCLPFVALLRAAGISVTEPDGAYVQARERREQLLLASLLMAAFTCLVLRTAEQMLPLSWSLLVALGATFGTQIWSSASRALWSHSWEVVLGALVILELLRSEKNGAVPRMAWVATILSWMFFVRPTGAVVAGAATIYMIVRYRERSFPLLLTGGCWLAAFVVYSEYTFGQSLPSYYRHDFHLTRNSLIAFAGNLISPSRGLFIFVPEIMFIAFMTARYWGVLRFRGLATLSIAIISAHLVVLTGDRIWYGGWSYGPRLATDLVPWFALLAVLSLDAFRGEAGDLRISRHSAGSQAGRRDRAIAIIGCLLLSLGVLINARGALSSKTKAWNAAPGLDERVWDWKDMQIFAGIGRHERDHARLPH